MASQDTLFTNDTGSGGGTTTYVTDALPDFTFPPTINGALTSNANTNPMGLNFANTDLAQFGAKQLIIKDLLLIQDRSKWINNKSTYKVIFTESFPQVNAYVFGDIQVGVFGGQITVTFRQVGDGFSVNGVIRQAAFLLEPQSAIATAQVVVDGVNGATVNFGGANVVSVYQTGTLVLTPVLHKSTPETYDLHDIRIVATPQSLTGLTISGVIVYFQNSSGNIDQFPGVSYVNKNKVPTTVGTSIPVPSMGSSLGGKATIYKTLASGYSISAISAPLISSMASGSSGSNLLTITTGQGQSYGSGYGIVLSNGVSTYVGSILSVSTDTFTMGSTLGFGTSLISPLYVAWKGGSASQSINASLMTLAYSIDFSQISNISQGFTNLILDLNGNYAFWGNNIGFTNIEAGSNNGFPQALVFNGASGMIQVDGYFSAAEIETMGVGTFNATFSVNGLPNFSQNIGQTGSLRKTIFTDAGPGWNSFNLGVASGMGPIAIQRINLYQQNKNVGLSFGILSDFDICQTFTDRGVINASMMPLGGNQRVYADQLYIQGAWNRLQGSTFPGLAAYIGSTAGNALSFQYYGKNFGIVGTVNGGSLLIDGIGVGLTFNVMQQVSSEGWHTLTYTAASGSTTTIAAVDYVRSSKNFKTDANIVPQPITSGSFSNSFAEILLTGGNGMGSTNTAIRRFTNNYVTGSGLAYVSSASLGDSVIVEVDGVYSMYASDERSTNTPFVAIIRNGNPQTGVASQPDFVLLAIGSAPTGDTANCAITKKLNKYDVLRVQNGGSEDGTNPQNVRFSIIKIG